MMNRVRYLLPLVGSFLAMAAHIYLAYGFGDWLSPQRFRDALGVGLIFAHLVALMIGCSHSLPQHLHWPAWAKYALTALISIFIGTLAWGSHSTFFLLNTSPDWGMLLLGGFALSIGFIAPIQPRHIVALLFAMIGTTCAIFAPIYLTFQTYLATYTSPQPAFALLYFPPDNPEFVWFIGLPFAICIAFFGHLPNLIQSTS